MLLSVALDRDMKAVQASVLTRFGASRLAFSDPYELFDIVDSAFSQYPYLDSIFVWRAEDQVQQASFFPVALLRDPRALNPMGAAIRSSETGE